MSLYNNNAQDMAALGSQNSGVTRSFDRIAMDYLFLGLMLHPSFLKSAANLIQHSQFNQATEKHYSLLFRVLCELSEAHGQPTCITVLAECQRELFEDPMLLLPEFANYLIREDDMGLICGSFEVRPDKVSISYCNDLLQEFLERDISNVLNNFMSKVDYGQTPRTLNETLDAIHVQRGRIQVVQDVPIKPTVPGLHEKRKPPSVLVPTGVDWIDNRLGGQRAGDANGIIGVTGAGKSTLAAYMAVKSAGQAVKEASENDWPEPAQTILFTYEESATKISPRLYSVAMKISRNKLETLGQPDEGLSTLGDLENYEILPQNSGGVQTCEQERWEEGMEFLNQSLKVSDMSGGEDFPNAGYGYVPEIKAVVAAVAAACSAGVRTVIIDYAGLVIKRYMARENISEERIRHFLVEFGEELRREVAEAFGCTVWIMHQVTGAAGSRSAVRLVDHTMAADAKSFAEHLAICGCMGVVDPITGCRLLNFSKVRYVKPEGVTPVVLRIEDNFANVIDVGGLYVVDPNTRSFVSAGTVNHRHGAPTQPAAPEGQPAAPEGQSAATNTQQAMDQVDGEELVIGS